MYIINSIHLGRNLDSWTIIKLVYFFFFCREVSNCTRWWDLSEIRWTIRAFEWKRGHCFHETYICFTEISRKVRFKLDNYTLVMNFLYLFFYYDVNIVYIKSYSKDTKKFYDRDMSIHFVPMHRFLLSLDAKDTFCLVFF